MNFVFDVLMMRFGMPLNVFRVFLGCFWVFLGKLYL